MGSKGLNMIDFSYSRQVANPYIIWSNIGLSKQMGFESVLVNWHRGAFFSDSTKNRHIVRKELFSVSILVRDSLQY